MSYTGFVCKIKNLRDHPNADRLYLGECFGNTVAVSRTGYEPDMIGIYFPCDGQLSVEFCQVNNLLRLRDENGHSIPSGGYMDPDKRNVTAIKLRGEKSDGIFLPLSCLDYCFEESAAAHLKIGDTIDVVNGHDICTKYIPRGKKRNRNTDGNRTRKKRAPIAPLFAEHADTEQLAYNLNAFHPGDEIEITLKMHGTSQRTAYVPVLKEYVGPRIAFDIIQKKGIFRFVKPLNRMVKWAENQMTPAYDWGYVSGTRRTILENYDGGYYGSNGFREQHSKVFEGKLWKGETVYYEVTSYTSDGKPIMANGKVPKEYQSQYGKVMEFSYGMLPGQSDMYVYRMTMTNEDGDVVEYTPDFMRYRCEQMGVKTVPVFWKGIIPEKIPVIGNNDEMGAPNLKNIDAGEYIRFKAEEYYDGPDPIGKTHVREGVVVRILNRPKFCAYKHKNWLFKHVSGIIAEAVADGKVEVNEDILAEL